MPADHPLAGPTAAILLIGEEILSGKVADLNARFLTGQLRALGIVTRRIEVIPDDVEEIAAAVRTLSGRFDHVFSTGGVGATHDDVTMEAVARAFGVKLHHNEELDGLIRIGLGAGLHERDLRMADIPEGAILHRGPLTGDRPIWPVVAVRNVFVLPGVPSIVERKFALLRDLLRGPPIHNSALFINASEGHIAADLDAVVAAFPAVVVGSYPHLHAPDYQVKVTLDARDPEMLGQAVADLARRLAGTVVRSE